MKKLNLTPEFTTVRKSLFNCIDKIDNDFLQEWVDAGAYVMFSGREDFWIIAGNVQLLFKIQEDSMLLECISTFVDDRRKGHGSEMMNLVVEFSKKTNTRVSLEVANVSGNGYNMMQHPVIGMGKVKKNKIKVASLPGWYEKFGFKKTKGYTQKKRSMIYEPSL